METSALSELINLPTNTVPAIVTLVVGAFVSIRDDNRASASEKKEAEIALSEAFHSTDGYYKELNSGGRKSPQKESDIAYLWEIASVKLRKFNNQLAKQLSYKSNFWQEGGAWTDEQIERADIGLEQVRKAGLLTFEV